ncbi:MAG: SusD/RagB family nutrient-binding outer membrane lipoprotein, partial [Bacteroidota bacterium]|nr:SusD/RagB family nutrient-binding outer membrane lipoprotein [Bacteroidota bacterium]
YNLTQRKDYAVSKTFTDRITNDPRKTVFATSQVGFPYGLTRDNAVSFANANSNYAVILANSNRTESSPLVIIGAANMWLARSEAAFRGWTSEDKTITYNMGVQRSMEFWGVYSATAYATYIAANPATDLQAIATQEWISWYPNGMEGWNTWRRTGYPTLTPAAGTPAIPRRFPYGSNEYNLNPTNVGAAAALYTVGGVSDSQFARIWWDQ